MEIISFEKVIENIENGKMNIPNIITKNTFVLVSNSKWTINQSDSFNKIIVYIQESYELKVKIIGGGKSCSKIIIELDPFDESRSELIDKLITDVKLHELAIAMNVDWIVRVATNESLNLKTGQTTTIANYNIDNLYNIYKMNNMETQNFTNSGTIDHSNINANLKDSYVETHPAKDEFIQAIKELELKINDLVLDSSELERIKEDLSDLKDELSKKKPRKKFLDSILESLSAVGSLANIIIKISGFLI